MTEHVERRLAALEAVSNLLVREVSLLDPGWAAPMPELPLPETVAQRDALAPSPDYRIAQGLPDPEPCGCEEAEALKARVERAEKAEKALAHVRHIAAKWHEDEKHEDRGDWYMQRVAKALGGQP